MDEREYSLNMEITGKRIKKAIDESGYSARKLQQMLGLATIQPVYRWQQGKTLPTLDHLYALCRILNVTMEDIIVTYGSKSEGDRQHIFKRLQQRGRGSHEG